jgi:hypothetical protein
MRATRIIQAVADPPILPHGARRRRIEPQLRSGWTQPSALPQAIWSAIAEASAIERSDGPEGTKPLITRHERRRRVSNFERGVDPAILRLLDASPSAVGRGLLLRAMHARLDRLLSSMAEIEGFAAELDGRSERELLQRATVLDLDSRTNDSLLDPLVISDRRGVIRAPVDRNEVADNDGLFQRLTASCGPTVVQMMICNADPISAFEVHRHGLNSDESEGPVADFQRRLLEAAGGVAIGRREAQLRARLRNGSGRLAATGAIDERELAAFRRWFEKGGPSTERAQRVLSAMREKFGGPTEAELDRLLRAAPMPDKDVGIGPEELLELVAQHVTPLTGVTYGLAGVFARGQCWRHLDRVERALRDGIDVPFGISEPGHWMLTTSVKGRAPKRSFLVSDPEGGRTAWVKEKDLRDGSFVDRQFHLCIDDQRGYVDCFLLPSTC